MHELAVTESILEISLRHAEEAGAEGIRDLYLVIGQLSSIVDDSVQFYWEMISKDTLAEGSRLHFRRIPAEMMCQACEKRFCPGEEDFACPECGSLNVRVTAGDEFYMEAIDVEMPGEKDESGSPTHTHEYAGTQK
ncbi:MAG: hydrogenase maturation nickel metallochaperone HypA [Anaerolineales bacterium]|jgi:hydrogenase nickel incorporation protein HypA/HybF